MIYSCSRVESSDMISSDGIDAISQQQTGSIPSASMRDRISVFRFQTGSIPSDQTKTAKQPSGGSDPSLPRKLV